MTDERRMTRRAVVTTAGATVTAPAFVDVAHGATASGNVELTTTSTQPSGTSISVRIYEDTTGDGSPNNQQEETVSAGSGIITEYAALDGAEGQGYSYWMEITLETSDDSVTPELDSATITLPESPATPTAEPTATQTPADRPEDPQTITEMWDNYLLYVASVVAVFTGIGIASRSLAIGAVGGYLAFAFIALETGTPILRNILYVTLVLIFIGFAFKFWRLEGMGE